MTTAGAVLAVLAFAALYQAIDFRVGTLFGTQNLTRAARAIKISNQWFVLFVLLAVTAAVCLTV